MSVTQIIESEVLFGSFEKKMNLFEWDCHVIDGHDYKEIFDALEFANTTNRPTMILANTIKGKGVSFMENEIKWHHSFSKKVELARQELGLTGFEL